MKAPQIVSALEDAAKRGVTVQVVVTNSPSWKTSFDGLKAAGVSVRTYKNSSKTLYVRAEFIEADNQRVFLGGENFSVGSLQYNRELGLITTSRPIVQAIRPPSPAATPAQHPGGPTPTMSRFAARARSSSATVPELATGHSEPNDRGRRSSVRPSGGIYAHVPERAATGAVVRVRAGDVLWRSSAARVCPSLRHRDFRGCGAVSWPPGSRRRWSRSPSAGRSTQSTRAPSISG